MVMDFDGPIPPSVFCDKKHVPLFILDKYPLHNDTINENTMIYNYNFFIKAIQHYLLILYLQKLIVKPEINNNNNQKQKISNNNQINNNQMNNINNNQRLKMNSNK